MQAGNLLIYWALFAGPSEIPAGRDRSIRCPAGAPASNDCFLRAAAEKTASEEIKSRRKGKWKREQPWEMSNIDQHSSVWTDPARKVTTGFISYALGYFCRTIRHLGKTCEIKFRLNVARV